MSAIEVRSAGVCVSESGVLLVNHSKHGRSYWVLPGGHVEFGERLDAALVREMREELQLDVTVGPLVLVHDFITETRHVVSLVFRVEPEGDAFSVTPGRVRRALGAPRRARRRRPSPAHRRSPPPHRRGSRRAARLHRSRLTRNLPCPLSRNH